MPKAKKSKKKTKKRTPAQLQKLRLKNLKKARAAKKRGAKGKRKTTRRSSTGLSPLLATILGRKRPKAKLVRGRRNTLARSSAEYGVRGPRFYESVVVPVAESITAQIEDAVSYNEVDQANVKAVKTALGFEE